MTAPLYGFGRGNLEEACYCVIRKLLPIGSTILELGSGWVTRRFSKHYRMISIEHDPAWLGKYPTQYIHAPLVTGWYDRQVLQATLPTLKYDMILVDGPPARNLGNIYSRIGFVVNLDLFHTDCMILFDDAERLPERRLVELTALSLGRCTHWYLPSKPERRHGFAIIPPKRIVP